MSYPCRHRATLADIAYSMSRLTSLLWRDRRVARKFALCHAGVLGWSKYLNVIIGPISSASLLYSLFTSSSLGCNCYVMSARFPTRVSLLEGMSDEDVEPKIFFLLTPKGKRCLIQVP